MLHPFWYTYMHIRHIMLDDEAIREQARLKCGGEYKSRCFVVAVSVRMLVFDTCMSGLLETCFHLYVVLLKRSHQQTPWVQCSPHCSFLRFWNTNLTISCTFLLLCGKFRSP